MREQGNQLHLFRVSFVGISCYLGGTVALLSAALWNGYPLIYSDTGTYIASGFELFAPADRPIVYGLFVRLVSMGVSLWPVAVLQSALLFFAIVKAVGIFFEPEVARRWGLIAAFILSLTTGLPWYSGQIVPDALTAAAILSMAALLFSDTLSVCERAALSGLFVFATATHFSHLILALILVFCVSLVRLVLNLRKGTPSARPRRLVQVWLFVLASWLAVPSLQALFHGGFRFSRSSHVFLMGRLLESGVLRRFLDENCGTARFRLCAFKDSLPSYEAFLWDPSSPVAATGGWEANRPEYARILRATLSRPRFLLPLAADGALGTLMQLTQNAAGGGLLQFPAGTYVLAQLERHLGGMEFSRYLRSRQNGEPCCGGSRGRPEAPLQRGGPLILVRSPLIENILGRVESRQSLTLGVSVIFTVALFAGGLRGFGSQKSRAFLLFVLTALFANAVIIANLATVCDRYSARVSWLLPFALLIVIAKERRATESGPPRTSSDRAHQ